MPSVIPAFTKTWSYVQNQSYTTGGSSTIDNKSMVLNIVNQLITWGWEVSGSGSSYYGSGARDGVNRWSTIDDIVASAWIELHSAAMGCYLVVKDNGDNGTFLWLGSYLGFSGGTPSATQAGTAPDSFNCNQQNGGSYPCGNASFSAKWHGWSSSDGYVNRIVVYVNSIPVLYLHFEKPTITIDGFPNCVMSVLDSGGSAQNMMIVNKWFTGSGGGWFMYYASTRQSLFGVLPFLGPDQVSAQLQTNVCPIDGNWMICNVGCGNNNNTAIQGIFFWFADLWTVASLLQEGATMPASGARQVVVCGDFLLPWTNVAMQVV